MSERTTTNDNTVQDLIVLASQLEADNARKTETIKSLRRSIAAYKANSTRRRALRNQDS